MRFFITLIILVFLSQGIFAQDTAYARQIIDQLSGKKMYGRGYVKHGDKKAARLIASQFTEFGMQDFDNSYFQAFSFPMNTFPGKMEIKLDEKVLQAVSNYVVSPNCPAIKGTFPIVYLPEGADSLPHVLDSLQAIDYSNAFVVVPYKKMNFRDTVPFRAKGIIIPKSKIYWWASNAHALIKTPIIHITYTLLDAKPRQIELQIQQEFIASYPTKNVMAFIPGTEVPDSFIVFTAHYDHLGAMGKGNYFPGANDNASGTAMVLSLARYFSQPTNQPKYSLAFLLFAAEESGLLGSMYYTSNPAFPLSQIKWLINLDMVGSGSEGISLVNGKANPELSETLVKLNNTQAFFSDIRIGGESCNSDHCFFHQKGVPSVFIFTRGPECQAYHNLLDVSAKTPLTKFTELAQLLILLTKE